MKIMTRLIRYSFFLFILLSAMGLSDAVAGKPGPGAAKSKLTSKEGEVVEIAQLKAFQPPSKWHPSSWSDPRSHTILDRGVNLFTAATTRKKKLVFFLDHRARQSFLKENFFRDFFGFDAGGLKIGLGLRYGILDNLDAGFYRLNGTTETFDVYEFDLRFRFLEQKKHHLSLALRAGVTWFFQPDRADAAGFLAQLVAQRSLFKRLNLALGVAFHSDSSGPGKARDDPNHSFALTGLIEVRIASFLAWNLEISASLFGYGAKWPAWSTSLKFLTPRHIFSLVVTNTQYTSTDGMVGNSSRGFGDLIVGFSITREL